jgi:hypothetical protein
MDQIEPNVFSQNASSTKKAGIIRLDTEQDFENERQERIYNGLIIFHRERIVRTLIHVATLGNNEVHINFDRSAFSCGIGSPATVLFNIVKRIIENDIRLVGVKYNVLDDRKFTIRFWW